MAINYVGNIPAERNPLEGVGQSVLPVMEMYMQQQQFDEQQDLRERQQDFQEEQAGRELELEEQQLGQQEQQMDLQEDEFDMRVADNTVNLMQQFYGSPALRDLEDRVKNSDELRSSLSRWHPEVLAKDEDGNPTLNVPPPEGHQDMIDETDNYIMRRDKYGEMRAIPKPEEIRGENVDYEFMQSPSGTQVTMLDPESGEVKKRIDVGDEDFVAERDKQILDDGTVRERLFNESGEVIDTIDYDNLAEGGMAKAELEQTTAQRKMYERELERAGLEAENMKQELSRLRNVTFGEDPNTGEMTVRGERYNEETDETEEVELGPGEIPAEYMQDYANWAQLRLAENEQLKQQGDPESLASRVSSTVGELSSNPDINADSPNTWRRALDTVVGEYSQASDEDVNIDKLEGEIYGHLAARNAIPSDEDGEPKVGPRDLLGTDAQEYAKEVMEERGYDFSGTEKSEWTEEDVGTVTDRGTEIKDLGSERGIQEVITTPEGTEIPVEDTNMIDRLILALGNPEYEPGLERGFESLTSMGAVPSGGSERERYDEIMRGEREPGGALRGLIDAFGNMLNRPSFKERQRIYEETGEWP